MLLEDFQSSHDGDKYFDNTTTGMPTPDDMMKSPEYFAQKKGKVFDLVYMSPDEYMQVVADNFGGMRQAMSGVQDDLVDKYAQMMKDGSRAPMPTLDYRDGYFGQEGRNRAMAAKKIGVTSMPVMIMKDAPKPE